jgi:hypothetical protein
MLETNEMIKVKLKPEHKNKLMHHLWRTVPGIKRQHLCDLFKYSSGSMSQLGRIYVRNEHHNIDVHKLNNNSNKNNNKKSNTNISNNEKPIKSKVKLIKNCDDFNGIKKIKTGENE